MRRQIRTVVDFMLRWIPTVVMVFALAAVIILHGSEAGIVVVNGFTSGPNARSYPLGMNGVRVPCRRRLIFESAYPSLLVAISAAAACSSVYAFRRAADGAKHRRADGLCTHCGYDLRAHGRLPLRPRSVFSPSRQASAGLTRGIACGCRQLRPRVRLLRGS